MNDNKSYAAELAVKFRVDNGFNSFEPVQIKTLLRKKKVNTMYLPLSDNAYGLSTKSKDNKLFMLLNCNNTRGRQHFTAAHEFYHLFYDENPEPHFCTDGESKNPKEKLADEFASCLLMPRDGIYKALPTSAIGKKLSTADIISLEQYFGVSHVAMILRLKDLHLLSKDDVAREMNLNICDEARAYGFDLSLYSKGNKNVVIANYGLMAKDLFDREIISEGHYNELMSVISGQYDE